MLLNRLHKLDPQKLAHYEKENYVAYYQRRWLRLFIYSIAMVKEAYQLNLLQAIYCAYLVARAEIAFAPVPNNDIPRAKAYMRRFYRFLQRIHRVNLTAPLDQVVEVELNWWIAHRQLFARDDNQSLVDALAENLVVVYGIDPTAAAESAKHRAQGMLYSDLWVRSGKDPHSPLLLQEEQALCAGYSVLKAALL